MDFLQESITEDDSLDPGSTGASTDTITLDITYDDPDLHALIPVASSKWASENLRDSLKQGRVTDDLWALGLPIPDAIASVSVTDNQYLCVRVVVTCDELVDLSSLSDPTNKYFQQLKIKSVSIVERTNAAIVLQHQSPPDKLCTISTASNEDPVGISPLTTVLDYYRRCHLQKDDTALPPIPPVPPLTPISLHEPSRAHSEPIAEPISADISQGLDLEELEWRQFPVALELGLQSRRLRDTKRELLRSQAEVGSLASQVKDQARELASTKAQLGDLKEILARRVEYVPEQADTQSDESHLTVVEAGDAMQVDTSEPLSCARCETASQSAKVSEMCLRTKEHQITLFKRRLTERDSIVVELIDALQSERRSKLRLEAELGAERQRRRRVEAMGEAFGNEAEWPFVVPDLIDVFLKLEGMVEEVNHEDREL